jgi:hypothetical protein
MRAMMEAESSSETSVYYNETARRYIREGCHIHTLRRENLKSHTQIQTVFLKTEANYSIRQIKCSEERDEKLSGFITN